MATLTERVNKIEVFVGKIDERLNHIADRLDENTVMLNKLEEVQERQELLIQSIDQSRRGDKKLLAVLVTFVGGLLGYIVKTLIA